MLLFELRIWKSQFNLLKQQWRVVFLSSLFWTVDFADLHFLKRSLYIVAVLFLRYLCRRKTPDLRVVFSSGTKHNSQLL